MNQHPAYWPCSIFLLWRLFRNISFPIMTRFLFGVFIKAVLLVAIPFILHLRIHSTFSLGIIPVRLPVYTSISVICMCTFVTYFRVWVSSQELAGKRKDIWFDFLIFLKPLPRESLLIKSYIFIHSISTELHFNIRKFPIYFHVSNVLKGLIQFIFFWSQLKSKIKKCLVESLQRTRYFIEKYITMKKKQFQEDYTYPKFFQRTKQNNKILKTFYTEIMKFRPRKSSIKVALWLWHNDNTIFSIIFL